MGLLSIAAKNTIAGGARYGMFLELDFTTGTERYWTGTYEKTHDGETWLPTGGIGTVTPVESSEDFRANGLTLEVAGVPAAAMRAGTLTAAHYKERDARWIIAIMNDQDSVVWEKPLYFTIDVLTYAITSASGSGPIGVCRVNLEHEVTRAARINNRRYSHADQTEEFSGDLGFEHLAYLSSDAEVFWGTNGTTFKSR